MTKPVAFSEDGARRVIAATKAVEAGIRDMPGIRFRDVGDDGDPVRLGKTTAAWNKGTTATINVWESGTAGSETETSGATLTGCVNKFADVATGKWVIVARGVNGSYYLIAAEC
jgi:flavin-dependent dehydrogenase